MSDARDRRLREIVRAELGLDGDVSLTPLTGGASRETVLITADAGRRFVLRIDTSTGAGASLALEARALAAAATAGVPVPRVCAVGTDAVDGLDYMIMEHVEGETLARRIQSAEMAPARAGLAGSLGAALARVHTVPPEPLGLPDAPADAVTELFTFIDPGAVPAPGLALGMRWLRDHRPEPAGRTVVHGDFRLGNFLIGDDGLHAVLDWELVHLGDPVEDLGWLCAKVWRFGSSLPVGGVGSREDLLDGYAAVAGWRPTAEQLRWWELYAAVRWGVICAYQAGRHLSGAEPSIELLAIGRRAAEQEFDVLLALGLAEPHTVRDVLDDAPDDAADAPDGPYGRPSVDDLVAGLLLHAQRDVVPVGGKVGFQGRVAATVARTVLRELRLRDLHAARATARLAALGLADDRELSTAVLTGTLDDRWEEVLDAVRGGVFDRLCVADPRHFSRPV